MRPTRRDYFTSAAVAQRIDMLVETFKLES